MTSRNDATKAMILFMILALLLPGAAAQKNNKSGSTISVRSELVTTPVVVTDRSGAAITKEDFVVLDNKQLCPVTLFEEVVTGTERVTRMRAPAAATVFTNILRGKNAPRH